MQGSNCYDDLAQAPEQASQSPELQAAPSLGSSAACKLKPFAPPGSDLQDAAALQQPGHVSFAKPQKHMYTHPDTGGGANCQMYIPLHNHGHARSTASLLQPPHRLSHL